MLLHLLLGGHLQQDVQLLEENERNLEIILRCSLEGIKVEEWRGGGEGASVGGRGGVVEERDGRRKEGGKRGVEGK